MKVEELLKRADITQIQYFLRNGSQWFSESSKESYESKIRDAERKSSEFFEKYFPDIESQEQAIALFDAETAVYKEVYFELGLLAGAKMGYDFSEKMKDCESLN